MNDSTIGNIVGKLYIRTAVWGTDIWDLDGLKRISCVKMNDILFIVEDLETADYKKVLLKDGMVGKCFIDPSFWMEYTSDDE